MDRCFNISCCLIGIDPFQVRVVSTAGDEYLIGHFVTTPSANTLGSYLRFLEISMSVDGWLWQPAWLRKVGRASCVLLKPA